MKLIFENWRKALKEKKQENSFDLVLPRDKEIVLKADQEA